MKLKGELIKRRNREVNIVMKRKLMKIRHTNGKAKLAMMMKGK